MAGHPEANTAKKAERISHATRLSSGPSKRVKDERSASFEADTQVWATCGHAPGYAPSPLPVALATASPYFLQTGRGGRGLPMKSSPGIAGTYGLHAAAPAGASRLSNEFVFRDGTFPIPAIPCSRKTPFSLAPHEQYGVSSLLTFGSLGKLTCSRALGCTQICAMAMPCWPFLILEGGSMLLAFVSDCKHGTLYFLERQREIEKDKELA